MAKMIPQQRLALEVLVIEPRGVTDSQMMVHGFSPRMLLAMQRDGLIAATVGATHTGRAAVEVRRFHITDAGRRALRKRGAAQLE
jgi:hypothetical protein